jgi:hypothetical protein
MTDELFVLGLALAFVLLFRWGFCTLPRADWQILASVPKERAGDGDWRGLNLTYYGLLTASAVTLATALAFVLLGAVGIPTAVSMLLVAALVGVCLPAATLIARLVERKPATFTVGGMSFIGLLVAPAVLGAIDVTLGAHLGFRLPASAVLAAVLIAYATGESLGRLACISFGCCYGRPVATSHPLYRTIFAARHFTFSGRTKKAVYEGGFDHEPLIPIQALTAVVYGGAGLVGTWLFLHGQMWATWLEVALVTQLWRIFSETLRADYRGAGRISAYQVMAALAAVYAVSIALFAPVSAEAHPHILEGLSSLWNPSIILLLQALWLIVFLHMGRSVVTAATISIFLVKERT